MAAPVPPLSPELLRSPSLAGRGDVSVPPPELLDLPVKAVQFGTGAFLRGFVDDFLDRANRQGLFGGRVVAVGSTGSGRDRMLNDQGGLYTLVARGVGEGGARSEARVISSLSHALSASDQWDEVLALARDPRLEVVFSNTTEVGITLDEGDGPSLVPPRSFPGKLTRFLHERATAFGFDPGRGVAVLPCELIEDNGDRLRAIVLALAERWKLDGRFAEWVERAVPFCNTLVDRIVPGAPPADQAAELREALGYEDGMLTVCELYRLFAIEGDADLRARLRFADADPGIVVAEDVGPYRERKLRLLNGTHTAAVSTALLCGCETVREAMEHELVGPFVRQLMLRDIVPTLDAAGAAPYAREVLDRFANPYVRHALFDITLHGTTKMRVRVVPTIVRHVERLGRVPASLAFGFASYLLFMRGDLHERRRATGLHVPPDAQGDRVREAWAGVGRDDGPSAAALVGRVAADVSLWGENLARLPGFAGAVTEQLTHMLHHGPLAALAAHLEAHLDAQPSEGAAASR